MPVCQRRLIAVAFLLIGYLGPQFASPPPSTLISPVSMPGTAASVGITLGQEASDSPQISLRDENVRYAGELTPEGLARLKALTGNTKITSLTIKSGGGEISNGIDFGNWVFDNKLDVIVEKGCFSSCANYVFPAGRKKIIMPGAVVAWHGSALQTSFQSEAQVRKQVEQAYKREKKEVSAEEKEKAVKSFMSNMALVKQRQEAFYQKIGVDEYVTRIGQEKYGARGFYFLSVEDMRKFGITNVIAPDDYPKTDLTELKKIIKVPLVYIKLK